MLPPADDRNHLLAQRFDAFIRDAAFPCLGAKSALAKGQIQMVVGRDMRLAWDDLRIYPNLLDLAWSYSREPTLFHSLAVQFEEDNRRLATHDRQHQRSRPRLGSGRKRGACANALGRSRGGFTSKIHARCDNQGLPVGFILTGGEASDYTAAEPLMAIPVATPKALLADKGYDGNRFRDSLLVRGILPIIPPRSNRKVPEHPDYRRYRDRNRVERMFGKLKQQRRIATRYDKTLLSFESFLNLAATRLWLKSFVNTA